MIITLYKAPLKPGCSTCWTNCPFVSFLFFCQITFFLLLTSFLFIYVCYLWCLMFYEIIQLIFFLFFFLHSFSLSSSFTFTSTQIWGIAVKKQNVPITASCVYYGCQNRSITKTKRCVVWMWEESLFFVSNSPHYRLSFLPRPSVVVVFLPFFWWKQCWISHKYTTWVATRLWSLKRW